MASDPPKPGDKFSSGEEELTVQEVVSEEDENYEVIAEEDGESYEIHSDEAGWTT